MMDTRRAPVLLLSEPEKGPTYQPIELDFITLDSICDHSLYLKYDGKFVLYRGANTPFTAQDRERLLQTKNPIIFVYCETEKDLRHFYEQHLRNIIENPQISAKKKSDVLYQCARGITQEIFENPGNKENISRSRTVVDNTLRLMAQGSDAFLQIIRLSGHDYYTYTHAINVMAFSVGLLNSLGIKDRQMLKEVGVGALLHDIGKAKVPHTVLNKPAPLNDDEWGIMKKHPSIGFEMLHQTLTPERSRNIVAQHHEKINGMGYPSRLRGDAIPIITQVVSLCDSYDAMTSNRCYKRALAPLDAFKLLTQELSGQFDPHLVHHLIKLLNLKNKIK